MVWRASRPRGRGGVLRGLGEGCVRGEKVAPRGRKGKEASSGHCPDGVVVCWPRCVWGARPALSSVGKARVVCGITVGFLTVLLAAQAAIAQR